ncbi:hypothetical protein D3C81_1251550 [compost metagenome]
MLRTTRRFARSVARSRLPANRAAYRCRPAGAAAKFGHTPCPSLPRAKQAFLRIPLPETPEPTVCPESSEDDRCCIAPRAHPGSLVGMNRDTLRAAYRSQGTRTWPNSDRSHSWRYGASVGVPLSCVHSCSSLPHSCGVASPVYSRGIAWRKRAPHPPFCIPCYRGFATACLE